MESEFISAERRESFAIIRLNRAEKLNALSREMIFALSDTFNSLDNETHLRAIILTGAGEKAFCAGTESLS